MRKRFANPRMLGEQKKASAQKWLAGAFLLLVCALLMAFFPGGILSLVCAGLCLVGAVQCWLKCSKLHVECQKANSGAEGEEAVAAVLQALPRGWSVECNKLINGIGDIDILVTAPDDRRTRYFAVEVKSHSGRIGFDGDLLYRTRRGLDELFERDFLNQSMQQALKTKEALGVNFVVPVIVFARAEVPFSGAKMRGVHVLAKHDLLKFLKNFEKELVASGSSSKRLHSTNEQRHRRR